MENELAILKQLFEQLGFELDEYQPHVGGERKVFAIGKFVLFGHSVQHNVRVVLKAACDVASKSEIARERICRTALENIQFAYGTFSSPEEILFSEKAGYTIQVTRFIEQDMPFLERPTSEQFRFALKGLKAMEAAHAATYEHLRSVKGIFPTMNTDEYISAFSKYIDVASKSSETRKDLLANLGKQLAQKRDDIERYCGFLTHFDFMPQNIRISGDTMFLLDHSSLRFGNKHESWARMINFMELYNPELARALEKYIQDNRAPEENESLRLMRLYRLGELLAHHARIETESNDTALQELSKKRVWFWSHVATAVQANSEISKEIIAEYKAARDSLRSLEEKERQIGLH